LIVGREASIVSTEAGTTRDIVEVSLDINGYLCTFADTAGLRSEIGHGNELGPSSGTITIGKVEQEGIRRAKAKAKDSDVVVIMASVERSIDDLWEIQYDFEALQIASKAHHFLIVINKCDNVFPQVFEQLFASFGNVLCSQFQFQKFQVEKLVAMSCKSARVPSSSNEDPGNVKSFLDSLVDTFRNMTTPPNDLEDLLGVTERQRQLLSACSHHLKDFVVEANENGDGDECDIVVAAEHLRSAADCLSRITGRGAAGDVEEVLGVVFEKFCVGK